MKHIVLDSPVFGKCKPEKIYECLPSAKHSGTRALGPECGHHPQALIDLTFDRWRLKRAEVIGYSFLGYQTRVSLRIRTPSRWQRKAGSAPALHPGLFIYHNIY
jgi:hypothetical protein